MNNILVIDKPSGMTSHDVVDIVRRIFKTRKVGHCGTLDPIATGVLVMLIGDATKLSAKLTADEKEYICTMALGVSTDSQDVTGKVIATKAVEGIGPELIKEAVFSFKGKQLQTAPMISAKHHKGKRLHQLARKGIEIERKPHEIEIKEIELLKLNGAEIDFRVLCSKGTYIRTLCHDIGEKLGCGAHMKALRRIRSGRFSINEAVTLDKISI